MTAIPDAIVAALAAAPDGLSTAEVLHRVPGNPLTVANWLSQLNRRGTIAREIITRREHPHRRALWRPLS